MSDSSDSPRPQPQAAASPVPLARADAASRAQRLAAVSCAAAGAAGGAALCATAKDKDARCRCELPRYTVGEEVANAVTHGIGVLLGIAGLVILIVKAAMTGANPTHMASAIVFGASLIVEYLASTLYHAIQPPRAKRILRIVDHSCIYLLIAGSYTPFLLVTLAPYGGVPLFFAIWAFACAGVLFEVVGRQRQPRWVTVTLYLVMGWIVVFRLPQLVAALDPLALTLLVVGGLCYTVGTIFYLLKKIPYMHSIWHLWVLAGSVFQYMVVVLFVL